jgi:hypothetical protein
MLRRDCEGVRRQLSAFHDEELPVGERIAIATHLQDCLGCALEAEDIRLIGTALRERASAVQIGWHAEPSGMPSEVLARVRAEREESFVRRAAKVFDDPQRLWATGGAVVASTVCALLVVGTLAGAARDHARSIAAAVQQLVYAARVEVRGPVILPQADSDAVMPAAMMSQRDGADAVSAFMAVVEADGRLAEVQLLEPDEAQAGVPEAQSRRLRADLLAAAATARFRPARIAGEPVAVNVVWLVAHTTVLGKLLDEKPAPAGDPARGGRPPRPRAQRLS